jgi:hypothetical protein
MGTKTGVSLFGCLNGVDQALFLHGARDGEPTLGRKFPEVGNVHRVASTLLLQAPLQTKPAGHILHRRR